MSNVFEKAEVLPPKTGTQQSRSLIPQEMKDRCQWIVWKFEQKDEQKKPAKMPFNLKGSGLKWSEPTMETHGTYEQAMAVLEQSKTTSSPYEGIGFVFTKDDPFVFIDLDKCFEGDKPNELAQKVLGLAGATYSEISPSGRGLHIFGTGKLAKALKPTHGKFEAYSYGRFSTVTEEGVENEGLLGDVQQAISYLQSLCDNQSNPSKDSKVIPFKGQVVVEEGGRNNALSQEMGRYYFKQVKSKEDFTEDLKKKGVQHAREFCKTHMPDPLSDQEIVETAKKSFHQCLEDFDPTKKSGGTVSFDGVSIFECMTEVFLVNEIVSPELAGQVRFLEDLGEDGQWAIWDQSPKNGVPRNQWIIGVPSKVKHMVSVVLASRPLEVLKRDYPQVFEPTRGDEDAKKLKNKVEKWAYSYRQNRNISQVVSLFQCDQKISARYSQFDSRKVGNLFPVDNGVIDLRTGDIFDHTPEMMITRRAGVSGQYDGILYKSMATCPKWEEFVDQITCGDKELAGYLQRLCGYVMSAGNPERKIITFYGEGRNGKTTLIKVISKIMGDASDGGFSRKIPITALLKKQFDSNGEEMVLAMKARFAYSSESDEGKAFNQALLKDISGGGTIAPRQLRVGTINGEPDFTLVIDTNFPIAFSATDQAMVDRVVQIPFDWRVPDELVNPNLESDLLKEREGILAWMVRGAVEYAKNGLGKCGAVERATKAYVRDNNSVALFLEDCVRTGTVGRIQAGDMHGRYKTYCEEQGARSLPMKSFNKELLKLNYKTCQSGGRTYWLGVQFIEGGLEDVVEEEKDQEIPF